MRNRWDCVRSKLACCVVCKAVVHMVPPVSSMIRSSWFMVLLPGKMGLPFSSSPRMQPARSYRNSTHSSTGQLLTCCQLKCCYLVPELAGWQSCCCCNGVEFFSSPCQLGWSFACGASIILAQALSGAVCVLNQLHHWP